MENRKLTKETERTNKLKKEREIYIYRKRERVKEKAIGIMKTYKMLVENRELTKETERTKKQRGREEVKSPVQK